jgi:catalase
MVMNDNQGGAPNYYPNSFNGPETSRRARALEPPFKVAGDVDRIDNGDEDNFTQARIFWNSVLDEPARKRLVDNLANHLVNAADFIQERAVGNFAQVSKDFGKQLTQALKLKQKHPQP